MAYRIRQLEAGIIVLAFSGPVPIRERFDAKESLEAALRERQDNPSVLVDLTDAQVQLYGAADALKLSEMVYRTRPRFSKLAYLVRPDQLDMVAAVVGGLYGSSVLQRFTARQSALDWLRKPGTT